MCYGCYELAGDLVASERYATQQPPPGLSFTHGPHSGVVDAHLPEQRNVGRLMYWHPGMWRGDPTGDPDPIHVPNSVMQIDVHPDHRRKGIGTAMFNWTKENVNPDLIHSHEVTEDGAAWSQSMGHQLNTDERLPRYADVDPYSGPVIAPHRHRSLT